MGKFLGWFQLHRVGQCLLGCFVLGAVWCAGLSVAEAQDHRQLYEQGRLYYKQRLYHDAKKSFLKLVQNTAAGKRSFNAHYYLARCFYKTGNISGALEMLAKAKERIKKARHKTAYKRFATKILALYGKLTISPEVDPDEVGRIKLKLAPKTAFSNKDKANFFKSVVGKIKRQGGLKLDGKTIYLPKGEYSIGIELNQCLSVGFFQGEALAKDFTIGGSDVTLTVKAKKSCNCPGNQIVKKEDKKVFCACPAGTGLNKKTKNCEVVKQTPTWPWIVAAVGAVAVGGGIAIAFFATQGDGRRGFQLAAPGGGQAQLWGP